MENATVANMHTGRKVSRIRELRGIKQETLAAALGVTQQSISKLEQSEHIEDDRLEVVAKALGVTVDAIKNFNEEALFNNISNTFHDNAMLINYQFNPIEKIMELYESKIALYERMLKEKDEMIGRLEKTLSK